MNSRSYPDCFGAEKNGTREQVVMLCKKRGQGLGVHGTSKLKAFNFS